MERAGASGWGRRGWGGKNRQELPRTDKVVVCHDREHLKYYDGGDLTRGCLKKPKSITIKGREGCQGTVKTEPHHGTDGKRVQGKTRQKNTKSEGRKWKGPQ